MIKKIEGLPENVVGVTVSGKVTGEEYKTVLIPAVEKVLKKYDKIRFLYVIEKNFDGYSFGAMLDDAKVGLGHFFSWERIAVVTDEGWVKKGVKTFSFTIPGKIKVYPLDELEKAKNWLCEKRKAMRVTLDEELAIVILEPTEPIDKSDFEQVGEVIDPFLESHGGLKGLIIQAKDFQGWNSTGAFLAHMKFIKTHYKKVDKIALVSDLKILGMTTFVAEHVMDIDVKLFKTDEFQRAKEWVLS